MTGRDFKVEKIVGVLLENPGFILKNTRVLGFRNYPKTRVFGFGKTRGGHPSQDHKRRDRDSVIYPRLRPESFET